MNDPDFKERVLRRVAVWLDDWPDDEALPDGLDPTLDSTDGEPVRATAFDLADLAGAVVACRRDVQIQGKGFKRLEERVGQLAENVAHSLERPAEPPESAATGSIDELLDLYDRITLVAREVRRGIGRLPRMARWFGARGVLESAADGIDVTRGRVEHLLEVADVTMFDPLGTRFDPATMRAVDTVATTAMHTDGSVVETLRHGARRGAEFMRPADVKVAKQAKR